jgi:hypothetical protein
MLKKAAATLFVLMMIVRPTFAYQVPQKARDDARHYSQMAREMFSNGRTTDGVKLLRLAIKTNPFEPSYRMDFVTIMSKRGELSLKEGNRREAIVVFKNVEEQLMAAAKLFKMSGDNSNSAYALMQVSQIYRYVYQNEGVARGYVQKALEIDPGASRPR